MDLPASSLLSGQSTDEMLPVPPLLVHLSTTDSPVTLLLPLLMTVNEYVMVCPAAEYTDGVAVLTSVSSAPDGGGVPAGLQLAPQMALPSASQFCPAKYPSTPFLE